MKTLLAVLVGLVIALVWYAFAQGFRVKKLNELAPLDPADAVPERAVLKVFAWRDYFPPDVFERLRIEKGLRVELTTFESDEEFLRVLASGATYDITMPADYIARRLDRLDLSYDINYAQIPNHHNIPSGIRQSEEMSDLFRCCVPYIFGTVALAYNARYAERLPLSWRALFRPTSPQLLRGRIGIVDEPRHALGIALLALGKSPNSRDPAEIRAAGDLIAGTFEHLSRLEYYQIVDEMVDGTLHLSMAWSGDVAMGMEKNKDLRFISPDEGSLLFFDCFAIMRTTRHRAEAEEFIDFMLRPDIAARVTNFSRYATLNLAASPYISRVILNGPAYYFPQGKQLHYRDDLGDAEQIYVDVWKDVRARYAAIAKPAIDDELKFGGRFIEGNDQANTLRQPATALAPAP